MRVAWYVMRVLFYPWHVVGVLVINLLQLVFLLPYQLITGALLIVFQPIIGLMLVFSPFILVWGFLGTSARYLAGTVWEPVFFMAVLAGGAIVIFGGKARASLRFAYRDVSKKSKWPYPVPRIPRLSNGSKQQPEVSSTPKADNRQEPFKLPDPLPVGHVRQGAGMPASSRLGEFAERLPSNLMELVKKPS